MGQVVGVVAVWNKNWNGSFFYCKFKKIWQKLTKNWKKLPIP
jgi:hypothetical protein